MTNEQAIVRPLSQRSAGVLMHLSSLPAKYGVGDCGPAAMAFVDFLKTAGQSWWQVLPLGPMGMGYSPYQTFSSFAGSALWVSPDALKKDGWLKASDLTDYPAFPKRSVEYEGVSREKHRVLGIAFGRFLTQKPSRAYRAFEEENADWLDDYALFTALQLLQRRALWTAWPEMLRKRERGALTPVRQVLAEKIAFQKFVQFLFDRQWKALKAYANENGVGLIGHIPFFVPHDSADVWAHPKLFKLDAVGRPRAVAGMPPDLFSKAGQRWGHPVYDWDAHREEGFAWWIARARRLFNLYDVVRLDNFNGFHRVWEIPTDETSAAKGRYRLAPGEELFKAVMKAVPRAAFIADDLGDSPAEVTALREKFGFPRTSVLQFAFSGDPADNPHLPFKLAPETVVYTGTHDQNTIKGWFSVDATEAEINRVRQYIGRPSGPAHWQLVRLAYASPAGTAIIPMQDILGLGPEARMNYPGRQKRNWVWRMAPDTPLDTLAGELRVQAERSGRLGSMREAPAIEG